MIKGQRMAFSLLAMHIHGSNGMSESTATATEVLHATYKTQCKTVKTTRKKMLMNLHILKPIMAQTFANYNFQNGQPDFELLKLFVFRCPIKNKNENNSSLDQLI